MLSIRRLRLATGLILFTYVTLHLLNLSLGLAGLEVMTAVGTVAGTVWGSPPGFALLYGALTVHMGLALVAIYRRDSWRMPLAEALQLVLALSIPLLLAIHVISMRGGAILYGIDSDYRVLQTLFWSEQAASAVTQTAGLIAAWVHGCLGVYFWLRLKPFFERWRPVLAAAATAVPLAGLAGFVASGREVMLRAETDPDWADRALAPLQVATGAERASLRAIDERFALIFVAVILATITARWFRVWVETRGARYRLSYAGGRVVVSPVGMSILEASRANAIPHASVCGGRGRCSTCRVQVEAEEGALDPPGEEEARVLARIRAPVGVRLACQARPRADVGVTLLLPPTVGPRAARASGNFREGEERTLAVMFADLRGFTALSEAKLPYDVVFMLNRFAREMGAAIEAQGGRIDKFMGDGVMALFGLDSGAENGAREALAAAREMQRRLDRLNEALAADLPVPLRMGIGIHAGPVIVGEIGYGAASSITAIGDVVNIASRLEAQTKELGASLVVSDELCALAREEVEGARPLEVAVKGRADPVKVHAAG